MQKMTDPSKRVSPFRAIEPLQPYIEGLVGSFGEIPEERKEAMAAMVGFIRDRVNSGAPCRLVFICTHNSRRSQFSQIWARVAVSYYGIPGVETYSGGTETTACNERTIGALRRAGFSIVNPSPGAGNPRYLVQFGEAEPPLELYSKVYSDPENPQDGYLAVMTCSDADENCPIVTGCAERVSLTYVDPKLSDGTPEEAATYDARCREIGRELLFLMSQTKQ